MNAKDVKNIGIVGAGFIAPGVALVFAAKNITLYICEKTGGTNTSDKLYQV